MILDRSQWLTAFGLLLLSRFSLAWMDERPVLEVRDGNLFITSALDKNITLQSRGSISFVNINGMNLLQIATSATDASELVERWRSGILAAIETTVRRLIDSIEGPSGLQSRMNAIELGTGSTQRPSTNTGSRSTNDAKLWRRIRLLNAELYQVKQQLMLLQTKVETDECVSNPCLNGGTCEDIIDGYKCRCAEGWEGPQCNVDINECYLYAGTDLGCQNGATCRNLPGTYQCNCRNGFTGIHCARRSHDCNNENSNELCGHGTCINKPGSSLGYTCICEQGWEAEGTNPACIKDVDECIGKHPSCSISPFVPCMNAPGTFSCGPCPQGYTGNGYYCTDIDECAINNGGCSTMPLVQCINTMGSRNCGTCPGAYEGDGRTCSYVGPCTNNNGGCHTLATCLSNPGLGDLRVQCRCPPGYEGDGMGPDGCIYTNHIGCSTKPCVNGTCIPHGAYDYTCQCEPAFTGRNCNVQVDLCDPNPCENSGNCSISLTRTPVCQCTADFSGPQCRIPRQDCGGSIRDPAGVLQFPSHGNTYRHGLSCVWILETNSTRVLNVTFTGFKLEHSPDCNFDFLKVYNGRTSGDHIIGKYCGNELPAGGNIISTHNYLYLWFQSDATVASDGFTLHWNSVVPVCGGEINADHGAISSPGSPDKYPLNRDCYWHISVTAGKFIHFQFFTVMLEEHPTCQYDYLEVRDGPTTRSQQLGIYCNHTYPPPLEISGSEVWLHFHSDNSGQDAGFQLTFAAKGRDGCWGNYTAPTGFITSPSFGSNYENNMECEWKIQMPTEERVRITWQSFHLENSQTCSWDFVEVYDGENREAPLVGRYCGDTRPQSTLSTSSTLLIRFKSDHSNTDQGFKLNYEIWCGGEFTASTGIIKSPFYPNPYPGSRTCIYEIIQPPGKAIKFTIHDLDIERSFRSCHWDYLEIRDGDNENSAKIGTYCGGNSTIPEFPIMSTYNYLWLKFKTDSTIHRHGFMATYETVDRRCGALLKAATGVIQSPTEGGMYSNREDCTWVIQAPPGHIVLLNWLTFDLEYQTSCRHDYVKIFENTTATSANDMGTFCGSRHPPTLTTQSPIMTIKFHTDGSVTGDGFSASYIFLDASKVCGGHFRSLTGVIKSPNYPNHYPHNRDCEWIIQAPNNHQVALNVKNFNIELDDGCTYDYLEIRNGGSSSSPLMGKYCGTNITSRIISFGNQIYVKFHSDVAGNGEGFNIEWDSTTIGCGGTFTTASGSISSPNYPQPYGHSAECNWNIRVSAGNIIQFVIVDIELEPEEQCNYDFIEIYEGLDGHSKKLGRYCESHRQYIQTTSNLASIRFHSDSSNAVRGFHMNYHTLCHRKLRGFRGVIESPNYPNPYPNRENCSWIIEAPRGNKLNITFTHFNLEEGQEGICSNDYLDIKEGVSDTPNKHIGKYCHSAEVPPKVVSTQNQVFLEFYSDANLVNNGFRLEWVVNGCGGVLRRPEGTITSPGYPNQYPSDIECEWHIEVDYFHSIEITFVKVDLEKTTRCSYDKVSVYSGDDASALLLAELCYTNVSRTLTSTGNKLIIKFQTDGTHQGSGFMATYKSVSIQCGGRFTVPTGVIHSTGYPNNYPARQNCEWLIQVPVNHLVNLTFTDFDIEDSTNCTVDYVRIYDGSSQDARVLGSHCSNSLPPSYTSSNNEMLVVMRTDSTLAAKGFRATYDLACGARIVTNDQGILSMDPAVGLQTDINNCTWTIIAQDLGDHVTLTLMELQVNSGDFPQSECENRFIQVFEGEGTDGPLLGTWCGTKIPLPITSQGNALTIHATSLFGQLYNTKFSGMYSVLESACGGNFTSEHGSIATPGYPNSYPRNVECIWYIHLSPGNRLSLNFKEFNVFESEHCNFDYVEVREENAAGTLIGTYCGTNVDMLSSSKSLWIKFESSAEETKKGFIAEYNILHGGDLSGPRGEIASPLYPKPCSLSGEYFWRINVEDPMSAIKITFTDFQLEKFEQECSDSVTVYDGYNDDAPELMSKCGVALPEAIRSTSNVVYIKFFTLSIGGGSSFRLNWLQVPREGSTNGGVISKECGGQLYGTNGVIEIMSHPFMTFQLMECQWNVTVRPGRTIEVKFSNISIETTDQICRNNYLMLKNGGSASSPILGAGKYCGNEIPGILQTTGNQLYVKSYGISSAFFLRYREIGTNCGGGFVLSTSTKTWELSSPNYPNIPFPYSECFWTIMAPAGETIMIDFLGRFDLKPSDNCELEHLDVRDGGTESSELLGRYCHEKPDSVRTIGNVMYIHYYTNLAEPNNGFQARVSIGDCGGTIRSRTGVLHSPNYPAAYQENSNCTWNIIGPDQHYMELQFREIDLPRARYCENTDHVIVSELAQYKSNQDRVTRQIGKYCGNTVPALIESTENLVQVTFRSYNLNPYGYKGFSMNFTTSAAKCGGVLEGSGGEFSSPGYPNIRTHLRQCRWKITVPEGYRVQVELLDFDLGTSAIRNQWSWRQPQLNFYDSAHYSILKRLRANDTDRQISSPSNRMTIQYTTNSNLHRGFRARYISIPALCGGIISSEQGTVIPNLDPLSNISSPYCIWTINSPWNMTHQTLAIYTTGIDHWNEILRFGNRCHLSASYLAVEGGRNDDSYVCGVLSHGAIILSPLLNNKITVFERESNMNTGASSSNFTVDYIWHQCGGVLGGPSHIISAPTNVTYPTDCIWHVNLPDKDETIKLTAIKLNLGNCDRNFIRVSNYHSFIPQAEKYCGSIPFNITSSSNHMWIEYHAEDANNEFEIQLDALQMGCGGIIRGRGAIFSSPGYPKQYPNNAECRWELIADNGYYIEVVFMNRFNLETSDDCANDFVQVLDWRENELTGSSEYFSVSKFCGRNLPSPINSTSNKMQILFRSNSLILGDGFQAKWNSKCGGILPVSVQSKILVSPLYGSNLQCNYTFLAPGKYIIIKFIEFSIDYYGEQPCPYNNVSIITSRTRRDPPVFCGRQLPPTQRALSRLELHLKTHEYMWYYGFRLSYVLDECGGEINGSAVISSPSLDNDGSYYAGSNCTWIVRAPAGKAVVLSFERFDLEPHKLCSYDYLNVYTGLIIQKEQKLASLCGNLNDRLPVVKSDNGSMLINFFTDASNNHDGFRAKVSFSTRAADGCGGKIELSGSQIFRTQRDTTYSSFEDCHWLIQVPSDNAIKISINTLDLKNATPATGNNQTNSCDGDYLKIYDGPTSFSQLIGTYCGNVVPPPMISSSNKMWIRLVTDGTLNGKGVTAIIESLPSPCGNSTLIVDDHTKVLTSPGFPAVYGAGIRCNWKVTFADEAKRFLSLTIHFVQFDLENSENCTEDLLSITNHDVDHFISEGFGKDFIFSGTSRRINYFWLGHNLPSETFKYCGNALPVDYHNSQGDIMLSFKSSQSPKATNHTGFKLEYSASNCNRNYTSPQGRILHQNISDCWFTITVPVGNTISLYFNEFSLESLYDCASSGLKVYDGGFNSTYVEMACSERYPNPFFSSGNTLSFHSWKRQPSRRSIYDITYLSTTEGRGCGGELFNYKGHFTSPLYPGQYRNMSECIWVVTVPMGHIVQLNFIMFDIGTRAICESDNLQISDISSQGTVISSKTYCGEDNPATHLSTQGKVSVKYKTSVNNGGIGWIIGFEARQQGHSEDFYSSHNLLID